ncbi:MAG: hypothetical protein HUK40_20165 [Desulfobacter sp.]|nr:hypothetical protein [Desulfobacter sp.]
MLEFLKKKNKKTPEPPNPPGENAGAPGDKEGNAPDNASVKKKKRFSIKKLIFMVLVLTAADTAGFFAYTWYFSGPGTHSRTYKPMVLAHVNLPPEMLKFSFEHFPDLYDALIVFNGQIDIYDSEIQRIQAIGEQYPEQNKIAQSQKKIWVNGKNKLLKAFAKLEKPVKETFVLFQVNPAKGLVQVEASAKDLTTSGQTALTVSREQTAQLNASADTPPEGMVQTILFKIKKIF